MDQFPITYNVGDVHGVHSTHVETVVLLSDKKVDGHVSIDLDIHKIEHK